MWFWYALLAAIIGAVSVIINKKALEKANSSVVTWAIFTLQLPATIYLAFKEGIPNVNSLFLVGILGSALFFVGSKLMTLASIKQSVLSRVFPLMSLSVMFTYIFALIFLGETVRLVPTLGLLLVVFGAYALNAEAAKGGFFLPFKLLMTQRASRFYAVAMIGTSIASIFDKMALINIQPNNPAMVLLGENIAMMGLLTVYLQKRIKNWVKQVKDNLLILLIGSLVYLALGMMVFYGFSSGPIALVIGVKKLQIVLVLLLSWLFFGDKPDRYSWVGTALMLVGAVLIKVF